jgi:hypothetical protein
MHQHTMKDGWNVNKEHFLVVFMSHNYLQLLTTFLSLPTFSQKRKNKTKKCEKFLIFVAI